MIITLRILATVLLGLTILAATAVIAADSLTVSWRLTLGFILAPILGWTFAFFGGTLGELIGVPSARVVDTMLRGFGLLVLVTMCILLAATRFEWL